MIRRYLTPNEKFRLLRSAAHALWLLDPIEKAAGTGSAFLHKKIKRDRFGRWFRRYPIVPMYGDMFANLQHILSRAPSWPTVNADDFFATSRRDLLAVAMQYELPAQLPVLRTAVCDFTAEWTSILRRIKTHGGGDKCMLPRQEHTALCVQLVQVRWARRSMHCLACDVHKGEAVKGRQSQVEARARRGFV